MFGVLIGTQVATHSGDFFSDYRTLLGGTTIDFRTLPLVSLEVKKDLDETHRLSLNGEIIMGNMTESYNQPYEIFGIKGMRSISQNLSYKLYNLLFHFEFTPVFSPYKSYISLGAGIVASQINWDEKIVTGQDDYLRKGGKIYNGIGISPSIGSLAGIELDFDTKTNRSFLKSLLLEVKLNFLLNRFQLFKDIKNQFLEDNQIFNKTYALNGFYIGIFTGLMFNL